MAGDTKNAGSERDAQSLVADLLRRVTSPEVLAGVAGAAAAARFTKHLVEDSEESAMEEPLESDETQDAAEEDSVDDEPNGPHAEEDETDKDEEEEPSADRDESDVEQGDDEEHDEPVAEKEQEPEEADRDAPRAKEEHEPEAAPEADEADEAEPERDPDADDREETSDSSANGSVTDGERMELLDQARKYAEQLTGHPVESFSSLERDDRGWRIGMEVVELPRVPSTTDVLGSYELVLSDKGEFVDFRRGHRYSRNSTDDTS
jgi:gas vesicle protein GvpO